MQIIYLTPRSGYVTDLRSDTLWGTLCWGIRHLWGDAELEAFIDRCKAGNPDFVISSAFPFKQHASQRIPFFPNPFVLAPEPVTSDENDKAWDAHRLRKKLKKISLLGIDDFRAALHGELSAAHLLERLRKEDTSKIQALADGKEYVPSATTAEQAAPKKQEYSMTHNTIDRLRGGTLNIRKVEDGELVESGQLFHAEEIWWADPHNDSDASKPNTGLFFLVEGAKEAIDRYLLPVLRLLRHTGIGADRSSGKGAFDFEMQPFSMPEPPASASNALLNLSLFRPTKQELEEWENPESNGCWQYQLELREGFVGGYKERRPKSPRTYFREGSVFKRPSHEKKRQMGCIHEHEFPDLPHEVWDNGFGFMVNLNWKIQ